MTILLICALAGALCGAACVLLAERVITPRGRPGVDDP